MTATLAAVLGAAIILVAVVLPAEYGIDITGFGELTGLTRLADSTPAVEIADILGGNEALGDVEIPDVGEPTPLPNPNVFQDERQPARSETLQIAIPPAGETEIKTRLREGKVIVYSWEVDSGDVYVDYHGHNPAFGVDFFVRYKEQERGTGNSGSLTAPFAGEHGWYWINQNQFPVVITLTVTGFYDAIIDYGIF